MDIHAIIHTVNAIHASMYLKVFLNVVAAINLWTALKLTLIKAMMTLAAKFLLAHILPCVSAYHAAQANKIFTVKRGVSLSVNSTVIWEAGVSVSEDCLILCLAEPKCRDVRVWLPTPENHTHQCQLLTGSTLDPRPNDGFAFLEGEVLRKRITNTFYCAYAVYENWGN